MCPVRLTQWISLLYGMLNKELKLRGSVQAFYNHWVSWFIICNILYTVHFNVHCTHYNVNCTHYTIHCTHYNIHCTLPCTLYTLQCTLCNRKHISRDSQVDGGKYNLPVFANQTRIDDLRRSRLREDDVLVVTYPKSGEGITPVILRPLLK